MELYHFLNKCSLRKSRLESKSNHYCSEPDLLNWYWSELFPGEAVCFSEIKETECKHRFGFRL